MRQKHTIDILGNQKRKFRRKRFWKMDYSGYHGYDYRDCVVFIRYCIHRWSMRLTRKEEDTEMTTVVPGGGQVQAYI
jgi:hypothetical protein